jgi:methionine synthase I (cobalamin-dependent)/5,10-methylenetetrahydrofolate reductase
MQGFLEALGQRVLVCDGAMGTQLYAKGVFVNRSFDELNVTQPDLVAEVHADYVRAGADVLETNTFGANRFKLANFGLADRVRVINVQGARIARHAARERAWVGGSIGPLGVRIEPWGRTGVDEAEAIFREQADALIEGGVDLFMLETFRDLNEMLAAIRGVRQVSSLPIVAQMTTEEEGGTLDGTPVETYAPQIIAAGADVVGVNCSVGPAAMLETVEALARVTASPLSAQPNAGRPRDVDGRNLYLCSPEYMATYARRFVNAGARLVGGCCGTTPEHIRQIAATVHAMAAPATARSVPRVQEVPLPAPAAFAPAERSALARALAARQFVCLAEVAAPRGLDLSLVVQQAQRFRDLGAVAVNIPDYPRSGARASALALATLIERQGGVETLLHCSCRDHRLIGMQTELVGAHSLGIRNVLLTTGQPAPEGTYPDATSVFDVDAIGLMNLVARLNRGQDIGGQAIGAPTRFFVGAAVNPFAPDTFAEFRRLTHKVEAGADFMVTPPIFDIEAFDAVLPRLRQAGRPIVASLAALDSLRQAEFFASEVTGARVPDAVFDRLRSAADQAEEGVRLTIELASALAERVDGVQITSVHGSVHAAERVLAALRDRSGATTARQAGRRG